MSLKSLIEMHEGFNQTGANCMRWEQFPRRSVKPVMGPNSTIVEGSSRSATEM